jgi:uncharacterized damage-inducible protein DinB
MATGTKMSRKPAKPARKPVRQAVRKSTPKVIAKVSPQTALAIGIRDYFVQRLELEHATTLRVLMNVNQGSWRPDPKSRTAIDLAWHIASSERWFFTSVISGNFNPAEAEAGPAPATMREIISYHEDGFARNIAAVKKLRGAHMAKVTDFFGMKHPMYEYLGFALVHTVHHRAQLATYLRPLGGKCPDIYGGSADEPFKG